jgi:hypothetical protein
LKYLCSVGLSKIKRAEETSMDEHRNGEKNPSRRSPQYSEARNPEPGVVTFGLHLFIICIN